MPALFHFDCIFYYVSNLDRSIRFYTDILDFKLASRDAVARFEIDGILFELVPTIDSEKLTGHGNARLALRVDDIDSAIQILRAKGTDTSRIEDKQTGLLAFFHDPDHNEICLWQYSSAGHPTHRHNHRDQKGDRGF